MKASFGLRRTPHQARAVRPRFEVSHTLWRPDSKLAEANVEPPGRSAVAQAAWLPMVLAAVMQFYDGLSSVLLPFFGEMSRGIRMAGWMVATGALQLVIAVWRLSCVPLGTTFAERPSV